MSGRWGLSSLMSVRFIADAMLGRLALWMRVVGCDVVYENAIGDDELIDRAKKEGRVILTRDTLLVKRRWVRDNHLFIDSDRYRDQLRQVVSVFGVDKKSFLTRCLLCNDLLREVEKENVKGRVPPFVYSTQEYFSECPACGRLYWAGTHSNEMERELKGIL